jgi:hypothetical protein
MSHILPAATWYFPIICVRFFRAKRRKTVYQQKKYRSAEGKKR